MNSSTDIATGTIDDFSNQWQIHGRVDADYWTDPAILRDYDVPLLDLDDSRVKVVAELGYGSGRIVRMLSERAGDPAASSSMSCCMTTALRAI